MTTLWLEQHRKAAEEYRRKHGESPLTNWWDKTDTSKIKIRTRVRRRYYITASGTLPKPEKWIEHKRGRGWQLPPHYR